MSKDQKIRAQDPEERIMRALENLLAGQAEILAKQGSILGALPLMLEFKKDRDLNRALAAERSDSLEKGKEFWERRKGNSNNNTGGRRGK